MNDSVRNVSADRLLMRWNDNGNKRDSNQKKNGKCRCIALFLVSVTFLEQQSIKVMDDTFQQVSV